LPSGRKEKLFQRTFRLAAGKKYHPRFHHSSEAIPRGGRIIQAIGVAAEIRRARAAAVQGSLAALVYYAVAAVAHGDARPDLPAQIYYSPADPEVFSPVL